MSGNLGEHNPAGRTLSAIAAEVSREIRDIILDAVLRIEDYVVQDADQQIGTYHFTKYLY